MMSPLIRCYHEGAVIPPHSFFILCKGNNAGMPGFKPWRNSFIAICPHEKYYNFYFWLIYGLHQAGKFKIRHRGSVIPFINLEDVRDLVRDIAPLIIPDWSRFQELLTTLDKCSKLKATLQEQVLATEKLQRCLIQQYLFKLKK